jgi:hypothetical protein
VSTSLRRIFVATTIVAGLQFAAAPVVQAQNTPALHLRNGAIHMEANAAHFAAQHQPSKAELAAGRYHLVLQFHAIPTQAQRQAIEAKGVRLLDYLPDLAYIASIPTGLDLATLPGVRGFMQPDARLQLEKGMFQGQYPDWARRGDKIEVQMISYQDQDIAELLPDLRSRYEVIDERPHPRRATLRLHEGEIAALLRLPYVQFVEPVPPAPVPDDIKGRSLHRSNVINADYGAGRHYDGTGVTIGLADDGNIGPHIDYTGRLTDYATANTGTHGDMTAGILFGAGNRDPEIRGHASGAYLHYWDIGTYTHIVDAVSHFNTLGVILTSTSYSQGQGGMYTTDAQFIDDQIHDNRQLEHTFSAGNAGTSDHGYGAGAGWGNITGGYKASKSVITCGNLNPLGQLDVTSSRGPADDGRIKPDICANGTDQLSTDAPNTNQVGGGTSAASPSVAGCVTQLYHAYKSLNSGNNPESALIKASILNTGNDLGNPGPDYKHGWGHINSLRAVRTLEENRYLKDSVNQGQVRTHTLTVPANTQELRVMVYWTDYPGNPAATKALVNDIDITVTNGSVYQPWVLNPAPNATTLNAAATRGVDILNNMEQVTIANPIAGNATVTVTGSTIPQGPQSYYLVYEFVQTKIEVTYPLGGEGITAGSSQVIRWDAFNTSGTFRLEYSTNGGGNWTTINANVTTQLGSYTWTVPATVTGQALVRVTDASNNSLTDQSDAVFTVAALPTNLVVNYVCPDSIGLSWTAASGATGYEVSHLGARYMDSVAVSSSASAVVYGLNPSFTHWFSVSSLTANNGQGSRMVAIEQGPGVFNCLVPVDAQLDAILGPGAGALPSCQTSATTDVVVRVRNNGTSAASNITVGYSLNGGAAVNEVIAGPLASGVTINHTFAATVNMATPGTYNLATWVDLTADGNSYNDSMFVSSTVFNSTPQSLPSTQNFESFGLCGTASDCEAEICALGNGWTNASNIDQDDIDWRVDEDNTPSANTGPDLDHNPGTVAGNYVYLEPSGGCFGKEAYLMSPCYNLNGATSPQASFWYHMYGGNMGTLHVDVLADGIWTLDAMPPISGDQGDVWKLGSVSLVPYIGKMVNVRWRGETGAEFESDMALDDITIAEANSAPIVNFVGSPLSSCVGSTVTFSDLSINNPNAWAWTITPNTFTYTGGTTQNSQNPQVQFSTAGTYTVSLAATNGFWNQHGHPKCLYHGRGEFTTQFHGRLHG